MVDADCAQRLWEGIKQRLNEGLGEVAWRGLIDHYKQVAAVEERERGRRWSDAEVFEALVRSVLSNSTDWEKVEQVLPNLSQLFREFDPSTCATFTEADVDQLVSWFLKHRAGSSTLRAGLKHLTLAAGKLCGEAKKHGSCDQYLSTLYSNCARDPKKLAVVLSSSASAEKIAGLGIPLAAEFLRNLGYDVSKPDRHINRAVGSFGWLQFRSWPDRTKTKPPQPNERELKAVMAEMEAFASAVGQRVAFVDNAVWILCARSRLYFSNDELRALAQAAGGGAAA